MSSLLLSTVLCLFTVHIFLISSVPVESNPKALSKRGVNVSLPHLELGLLGGKKRRETYDTVAEGQIHKRGVNVSAPGLAELQLLGGKKRDVSNQMEEFGINSSTLGKKEREIDEKYEMDCIAEETL